MPRYSGVEAPLWVSGNFDRATPPPFTLQLLQFTRAFDFPAYVPADSFVSLNTVLFSLPLFLQTHVPLELLVIGLTREVLGLRTTDRNSLVRNCHLLGDL